MNKSFFVSFGSFNERNERIDSEIKSNPIFLKIKSNPNFLKIKSNPNFHNRNYHKSNPNYGNLGLTYGNFYYHNCNVPGLCEFNITI